MKIPVGAIVRVNEEGWRAWHNPPVGLIGTIIEAFDRDGWYAIDFYESGWHNGHSNRGSLHYDSVWNLSPSQSELFEEDGV